MRNIPEECKQIEEQLHANDYTVADLCRAAEITRQTWTNWRKGDMSPTIVRWDEMERALHELLANG